MGVEGCAERDRIRMRLVDLFGPGALARADPDVLAVLARRPLWSPRPHGAITRR